MAVSGIRALFQSLFVDEDDNSNSRSSSSSSPGDSNKVSSPRRRLGSNTILPSAVRSRLASTATIGRRLMRNSASERRIGNPYNDEDDGSGDSGDTATREEVESEPLYAPRAADGEYTAWFQKRPLGIGLVPSTQLYGSWEVSSISAAIYHHEHDQDHQQYQQKSEHVRYEVSNRQKHRIARGDVVIAINLSCKNAQLPREQLAQYLQECDLPIAVTLRKPEIYGSLDSRSMATAMYPLSIEYEATKEFAEHKRFTARVPSAQWKRTLQHELSQNAVQAKSKITKQLAQQLVALDGNENTENRSPHNRNQAKKSALNSPMKTGQLTRPEKSERVQLSPMGEFEFTFNEHPIHLVLAPSTRMYGSVEIYDPKVHFPDLQVGDVVMAVNGDASVSRWETDDLIDFIAGLHPPVAICFRRPTAYRKYLEKYFVVTKRAVSSQSVANAMFPQSAEYKKSPPKSQTRKRVESNSPSPPPPLLKMMPRRPILQGQVQVQDNDSANNVQEAVESALAKMKMNELRDFSFKINSTDQFKLWNGGSRDGTAQSSAILTEKHVRFLWTQLPQYLTCNEMELVYSTRYHGWNLLSFYSKLEGKGPTIMVVQDTRDNIFGAFCSTSWKNSANIYGNGRSFVFTLRPQMKVFPWSGLESSFMYSRRDALFVGGGKKGIALCLQLDEMRGFTKHCDTFDNPPLADRENFECEVVEVWSFSGLRI